MTVEFDDEFDFKPVDVDVTTERDGTAFLSIVLTQNDEDGYPQPIRSLFTDNPWSIEAFFRDVEKAREEYIRLTT